MSRQQYGSNLRHEHFSNLSSHNSNVDMQFLRNALLFRETHHEIRAPVDLDLVPHCTLISRMKKEMKYHPTGWQPCSLKRPELYLFHLCPFVALP